MIAIQHAQKFDHVSVLLSSTKLVASAIEEQQKISLVALLLSWHSTPGEFRLGRTALKRRESRVHGGLRLIRRERHLDYERCKLSIYCGLGDSFRIDSTEPTIYISSLSVLKTVCFYCLRCLSIVGYAAVSAHANESPNMRTEIEISATP